MAEGVHHHYHHPAAAAETTTGAPAETTYRGASRGPLSGRPKRTTNRGAGTRRTTDVAPIDHHHGRLPEEATTAGPAPQHHRRAFHDHQPGGGAWRPHCRRKSSFQNRTPTMASESTTRTPSRFAEADAKAQDHLSTSNATGGPRLRIECSRPVRRFRLDGHPSRNATLLIRFALGEAAAGVLAVYARGAHLSNAPGARRSSATAM